MTTVNVSTQAEFDAEVKKGNRVRVRIGFFIARGNSSVVALENSSVEACGNSSVVAWGKSSVVACGNSSVEALENSSVVARGDSSVVALENSSVEACGKSSVVACGNSSVVARGNSSVVAWEKSSVVACGNSSVEAWGKSSVVAWGNSSVEARGNSSVEAWGNVFIRLFSAIKIKASAHVVILKHGKAKSIKGGIKLNAYIPKTPKEWCEFYGAKVRRGVAILFKALDNEFNSRWSMNYSPGTTPEAPDWNGEQECGGGLHFSPCPSMAKYFNSSARKFVACHVKLDEIAIHPDGKYPEKCKAKRVYKPCYEVDIQGNAIAK